MKRILLPILLIVAFICSCSCNSNHHKSSNSPKENVTAKISTPTAKFAYSDTVRINYSTNKMILDVLPLIPDSVFKTWEWSKAERAGMLEMIKTKNYFIDTTKDYNTIRKITPYFFETIVVDGNFSLAAYMVNKNEDYIFIAKNQVGDGSNIAAYEYAEGRFSELNLNYLLGIYFNYFLINRDDQTCRQQLEEVWPYLDYDFSTKNKIIITAALDKKRAENCLAGNVLQLKFNAVYKRFDVESVTWMETDKKNSTDSVAHN